jgi:hypothetical protein
MPGVGFEPTKLLGAALFKSAGCASSPTRAQAGSYAPAKSSERRAIPVFVHSAEVVNRAQQLMRAQWSAEAIGRELRVPPRTIRMWRSGAIPRRSASEGSVPPDVRALPGPAYAYLLGLYLGDGWIVAGRSHTYVLRLSLDQRYPEILESAARAIEEVRPHGRSRTHARLGCSVVSSYWKYWPIVFPQHGAGPKHARRIALRNWQAEITAAHPRDLIRGLIHADGSRFIAHQRAHGKVYAYARYSFSNRSEDIKAILCTHLDALEIRWTRPNEDAIAIARRPDVAKLDRFVGPKR